MWPNNAQTIHDTCTEVSVMMALDKRVFATQIIEYLGLLIDTILRIICIPQDKQRDLFQHLSDVITAESATASSLQSLSGKLNFIAKALPMGWPFIHRIYDISMAVHPHHIIPIQDELREDLLLWLTFQGWLPILDSQQKKCNTLQVFTDASANPKLGWGVYTPTKGWWSYGQWTQEFFDDFNPSLTFWKCLLLQFF